MTTTAAILFSALFAALSVYSAQAQLTLSVDERTLVINLQNNYRHLLATGQASNAGSNLPQGKNIYKVVYSTDIETSAGQWAFNCQLTHSPGYNNGQYGENIYTSPGWRTNMVAIQNATDAWWQELQKDGIGSDLVFTQDLQNRGLITEFTQLVWAKTTLVGCSVNTCGNPGTLFVVCQYQTKGNIVGQTIYEAGSPCQNDGDCTTYEGSTCDSNAGLCFVGSS